MAIRPAIFVGIGAAFGLAVGCSMNGGEGPLKTPGGAPGMRITLSALGELVDIEGFEAGNWVPEIKHSATTPGSLGERLLEIEVYKHDGSEEDLGANTGPSEHAHSGVVTPPWNTHPHCWIYIPGYGNYLTHC